jgi:chemotaxis protein methyltransferase CheR
MIRSRTDSITAALDPTVVFPSLVLTPDEFATVSNLARAEFGLELGKGKEQLVVARLGKLMRHLGFSRFKDYYRHLENDVSGEALIELIDVLTTNHTSFFREQAHFDFLAQRVFAERRSTAPIRIWCAASSTGEEPYSIAMTARETFGSEDPNLPRILATDISTRVLEIARKGIYSADRFPDGNRLRVHLLRGSNRWEGWYRMRPEILRMVEFRRINLVEPLPDIGRFALIFCRNVMIYFNRATQQKVVDALIGCLQPGGYLFVGHSESLTGIRHNLEQIQAAIYRKRVSKS